MARNPSWANVCEISAYMAADQECRLKTAAWTPGHGVAKSMPGRSGCKVSCRFLSQAYPGPVIPARAGACGLAQRDRLHHRATQVLMSSGLPCRDAVAAGLSDLRALLRIRTHRAPVRAVRASETRARGPQGHPCGRQYQPFGWQCRGREGDWDVPWRIQERAHVYEDSRAPIQGVGCGDADTSS